MTLFCEVIWFNTPQLAAAVKGRDDTALIVVRSFPIFAAGHEGSVRVRRVQFYSTPQNVIYRWNPIADMSDTIKGGSLEPVKALKTDTIVFACRSNCFFCIFFL
jgi:hypothetical protein